MTPNPSTIAMQEHANGSRAASDFEGLRRGDLTKGQLARLVEVIARSGNPDEDFFYLGGPMTGIPQFNFPRFHEVGYKLRSAGYNIVSPAELDDPETEAAAMSSPDGAPGSGSSGDEIYEDFLARDLIVCSLPTCIGGIFLEGWHTSRGARAESWALTFLKKQTLEYDDSFKDSIVLTEFDRDTRLAELGVPAYAAGAVPRDKPGLLTAAERAENV